MEGRANQMDFSKLDQNEKLAVYGAGASILGPILASVSFGFGGLGVSWLTLLVALGMLAVVFLPQLSPQTTLPGSKGSLMVVVGGIAAVLALLSLLGGLGLLGLFGVDPIFVLGWLIGVAGGLLMGWAGWQEFQAEGGKLQFGAPSTGTPTAPPPAPAERTEPTEPTEPAEPERTNDAPAQQAEPEATREDQPRPGEPPADDRRMDI
jgi:hypothetical protein